MLRSFQELEVWQKAHRLVLETYRLTDQFPDRERFGIISQIRRAAASVPPNIAEGFGRRTTKELLQFLTNANGSLEETRYFLILGRNLGYLNKHDYVGMENQCASIAQMMAALVRSLRERITKLHGPRVADHGARTAGHGSR